MSMQGSLREVNLPNLIELARSVGEAVAIRIEASHGPAEIFLEEGEVVHAVAGGRQGEEALRYLFPLQEGRFVLRPGVRAPHQSIRKPWNSLLLEILQTLDEAQLEEGTTPSPEAAGGPLEDLAALLTEAGLEGAAVISVDGLVYAYAFPQAAEVDEDLLGAVAASLHTLGARSVQQLHRGQLLRILVQGSEGHIVVAMVNPNTLLLALTPSTTSLGIAFAEVRTLAAKVAQMLNAL